MRGAVLALPVVVACYSPSLPAGAPCHTEDDCPNGQHCNAGVCSTGSTPPPPLCAPTSDPRVPDEDGDHLPDSCDPCPLIAGNPTTDTDGDGIPDACDPNLTVATSRSADAIWLFEGFRSLPPWAVQRGVALAADQNSAQITAPGGMSDEELLLVLPLGDLRTKLDDFRVTVAIRIVAAAATADDPGFGLRVVDASAANAISCLISQEVNDATKRSLVLGDDISATPIDVRSFTWAVNTDYTLELRRHGTSYDCHLAAGASDLQSVSGPSAVTPRSGAAVMISAFGITATVKWVYVVGSP